MADLPRSTTYKDDPTQGIRRAASGISKAATGLGASLPKRRPASKSVDVSRFSPLTKNVRGKASSSLGPVTTQYGDSTRYEKAHRAIDIAGEIGTDIPSFTGGRVTGVRTGQTQGGPDYGNYVEVTDPQGLRHRYSHLQNAYVKVGQQVTPQQLLGGMGNTGQTYSQHGGTGSHLDYRVWDAYNKYVDPSRFLK